VLKSWPLVAIGRTGIKMASKRTYKPKVEGYVPEALDGDNDGLVQDGTEFERPVGTEFDWAVEETFEAPALVTAHILQDGENLQTVAAMYLPEGMTRSEYARKLFQLNGQVTSGAVVRLG
jgi:hypothetical protein